MASPLKQEQPAKQTLNCPPGGYPRRHAKVMDWEEDLGLQRALFESLSCCQDEVLAESCYTIVLHKDPTFHRERRLGITIDQDHTELRILNWRMDSMIAKWNEQEGSKPSVRANDVIVRVNGCDINGSAKRLTEILENVANSEHPTITVQMRRGGSDDSAPTNRPLPASATAMELYSNAWYNGIGGDTLNLLTWDQESHEHLLQHNMNELDRLLVNVQDRQPTILYLIFGGLLPPKPYSFDRQIETLVRRGACLDRRFPAPLQRLLAKEKDATLLIAILDNGRPRGTAEEEAKSGVPAAFADRISVQIVPLTLPRWPCTDILDRFRLLRDEMIELGGLFIALDETKMIRKRCFRQNFALYPILDLCTEYPQSCLFLEWSSAERNGERGEIYTYRDREERAKEYFRLVLQWNGLRSHFEWDDQFRSRRGNVFNFAVEEKSTEQGGVQKHFSIDLTKAFYQ